MAVTQAPKLVSLPAAGDLGGNLYHAVSIPSGKVTQAGGSSAAMHEPPIGILYVDPGTTAADDHVTVALLAGGGVLKTIASGTINAGDVLVMSNSVAGKAVGVDGLDNVPVDSIGYGVALEAASTDQIFEFLAMPAGGPHTA